MSRCVAPALSPYSNHSPLGIGRPNKDTYDLFYVWNAVSIVQVATSLQRLQPNTQVSKTLDIIQRDFMDLDGLGPVGAALFIASELDDVIQADVSGLARELLRVMGRSI